MSARAAPEPDGDVEWVLLTRGDRPRELRLALESIRDAQPEGAREGILVVSNGGGPLATGVVGTRVVDAGENLGVPGGRHLGMEETSGEVVGFLDDDAVISAGTTTDIAAMFHDDPTLGAVAFRIVDDDGTLVRRYVPRVGTRGVDRAGDVVTFLGGASAIRRSAYEAVGGYCSELFYGHEELDLAWRLIDAGYHIRYEPSIEVGHPTVPISRHPDGWRLTGRNRVWIARRNLPWAVAVAHVAFWLVVGWGRAPRGMCRRSYLAGWWSGWRGRVDRRPMRWATVVRLTRAGRPPVI